MKKLLTAVLCIVLALSLTVLAGAEKLYEEMKYTFGNAANESTYLGEGFCAELDSASEKDIMIVYSCVDKTFMMTGVNTAGNPEGIIWEPVDEDKGLASIYVLCVMWNDLQAEMEEGYTLILGVQLQEDSYIWIEDAETAAQVVAVLESSEETDGN